MCDIKKCIEWIYSDLNNYLLSNNLSHLSDIANTDIELTACGHSAGGHIVLTSILDDPSFAKYIKNLICLAAVYDLESQYEKEKTRGVEKISGLYRVMRGDLTKYAPVAILKKSSPLVLEQILNNNPDLRISILHGQEDTTVDLSFIHEFTDLYQNSECRKCHFAKIILDGFNHTDFVKPLMNINYPHKKDRLLDLLSSIIL
ncbi:predicted protein [Naegleria gruberi]|uniref:Predicted protein n=1 Tax=Naegleria gruberi TaxID=5762 RepID=D2V7Z2_NAEGR|nr:uncharacterized protein NAEGRDRAFT_64973 [Naegleria gruberi]EFC46950.1 predicted protein [Naegleria gruberi]|eukprot:XP_002679694.1 predicted protein [Naegleria gruberi strain NEG-M]